MLQKIGLSRDRTDQYFDLHKNCSIFNNRNTDLFSSHHSNGSDNGQEGLLNGIPKSDIKEIEMTELKHQLPWFQTYELIMEIHNSIFKRLDEVKATQEVRERPSFNDEDIRKLDKKLTILRKEITESLQQAEIKIKELGDIKVDYQVHEHIKQNMKSHLLNQLQQYTFRLRNYSQKHLQKRKQILGEEKEMKISSTAHIDGNGP